MILAIVGSRDYTDWDIFKASVDDWCQTFGVPGTIVSGGARGADTLAKEYAAGRNISFREFPADWEKLGPSAGPIRNSQIVKACTHVLAFPSKKSRGTWDTINKARRANKSVTVVSATF